MNTIYAADGTTRSFSDDLIATVINNVIRFVYGNSYQDLDSNIELMAINTLSVIALNNIMAEAGVLKNWAYQDPFDKARFYEMIETIKEDEDDIEIIPMYNPHWNRIGW